MKVTNPLKFNGQFETIQNYNSSFYRTRMRVFAFGGNRNGSSFSLESFERAKESLYLIPIVAKFNESEDIYGKNGELEGHNVSLDIKDNEVGFKYDTYPIGVVSNNANIYFEEVNEGLETKTYVVVDEVYLWKRYDATKKISEWIETGIHEPKISMEIGNVEGNFSKEGYFQIDNFEFEAIAALGSDVEPCFPMATISTYSKQSFKQDFKEMLSQLKLEFQKETEGGLDLMEETQVVTEVEEVVETETIEEVVAEENVEVVEETFEQVETEEVTEEVEIDETDYKSEYELIKSELEGVNQEFTALKSELDELRQFKEAKLQEERNSSEQELFERFSTELSEDEIEGVKQQASEFTLEQLEEKLFTLVGKKKAMFTVKEKQQTSVKIEVEKTNDEYNPYGNILSKYSK